MSQSDVIRRAIEHFHDSSFPDYIYNKSASDLKKRQELDEKVKKETMTDEDFARDLKAVFGQLTTTGERVVIIHWFYDSLKALSLAGLKDLPKDVLENHRSILLTRSVEEELATHVGQAFLKNEKIVLDSEGEQAITNE
jgi:hypothetical protein